MRIWLKLFLYFLLTCVVGITVYLYVNTAPDRSVDALSERWAKPPSQFVSLSGMQIHLRDEGPRTEQPPIILIHGTSASLHTWNGWAEALKVERRVIRFDLPGFGLTGPETNHNYTIERYADIVVEVLDHLGIEKGVIAGNSLGGYVAWATAVLHPERVTALALVDPSGHLYEPESVPLAFRLSQNPIASILLRDVLPKSIVAKSVKNVYGDPSLVSEALIQRYYELALREGNRDALKQRFTQMKPGQLVDKLSTISVPTLIMWGAKDRLIPVKLAVEFERDIQGSHLVIFDDLGHVPHEEDPESTVQVLKQFLSDVKR